MEGVGEGAGAPDEGEEALAELEQAAEAGEEERDAEAGEEAVAGLPGFGPKLAAAVMAALAPEENSGG